MSSTNAIHAKAIELGKLVLRMTTASGSGHPSSALALAHVVIELMYRQMRYDPANPWSPANDRLVLSEGHAVPMIYAAYADLQGVVGTRKSPRTLTPDDLMTLRELRSVLDGHPNPAEGFPFFDAATGSLGQGLSVGAGLALSARLDGIDKRVYVIIGDGESREGQIWEAADFIVDHQLNNVCAIFSCNGWGQASAVSRQQSADVVARKMKAFGWDVIAVNGHDPAHLESAFDQFRTSPCPLAVVATTIKGWGVESIQKENYHGKPIPEAQLAATCAELEGMARRWGAEFGSLERPTVRTPTPVQPELASELLTTTPKAKATVSRRDGDQPGIRLPTFEEALGRCGHTKALSERKMATRVAYGVALVALGDVDRRIVALDGDVSNSTFANLFAKHHPARFIECKIAEQNMISVGAGLAAAGKIPFASSFSKFIARGTDQIDMASISRANLKIIGSHSGVSLAADGPSQMSLSDLAYFRSMTRVDVGEGRIGCHIFHPSDPVSAYRCCELMANVDGLCFLRTHRPDAPFLYGPGDRFELGGCKQLRAGTDLTLASSGYMVHVALQAAERLLKEGVTCNVFDAYTFPLNAAPILDASRNSGGWILTIEDNYVGGLHAELAEAAAELGQVRVRGITVRRMPKSARTAEEVFDYVSVGVEQILAAARCRPSP